LPEDVAPPRVTNLARFEAAQNHETSETQKPTQRGF